MWRGLKNDSLTASSKLRFLYAGYYCIDFHRLIEAIDNNQLINIDYIDIIDCLPLSFFTDTGTPGFNMNTLLCPFAVGIKEVQLYE